MAVLDPAALGRRADVGGEGPLPGLPALDEAVAAADPDGRLVAGGSRRQAVALAAVEEHRRGPLGADPAALGEVLAELLEEVAAALGGEGEADGAEADAAVVDLAFVEAGRGRAVRPQHRGVELRRMPQGFQDAVVLAGVVVGAQGVDVDLVVADDRTEVLRPEAAGVLLGDDLAHEGLRGGAPLGLPEGLSGDVQPHGVVARDVMDMAVHILADAGEAEAQAAFPGLAVGRLEGLAHEDVGADPAAVGPRHVDHAPGRVVLLAEDPPAGGVLVLDEGPSAGGDRLQQPRVVIPRVVGVLDGPGRRQGHEDILVVADPRLAAEAPGGPVLGLEDRLDALGQGLNEGVAGRPGGERRCRRGGDGGGGRDHDHGQTAGGCLRHRSVSLGASGVVRARWSEWARGPRRASPERRGAGRSGNGCSHPGSGGSGPGGGRPPRR